jgi:mono/diheme cytochrome c family protein/cytochrome c553
MPSWKHTMSRALHGGTLLLLVPVLSLALLNVAAEIPAQSKSDDSATGMRHFRDKVASLLRDRCLECHDARRARGGLNLSSRAGLLAGGDSGPAIVPGKARDSLLIKMVREPGAKMPRKGPKLSAASMAELSRWIDAGAPWPDDVTLARAGAAEADDWWATQPLKLPALPAVKDRFWPVNEIDFFILAMLEARGLRPGPPADRATFIRRVTYDLTGLPPTPQEIDNFLDDCSPHAFERLVDRLLASPHYGERWARHWLDIVHYADTHGYDKDKRRLWAWLYRDWVIRAFNGDMPYRRFVRYQLAGDVLFPSDPDGILATGFVVAGPWDFVGQVELREGTVEKEKTRTLDRDDMVANTMSTFTSLTVHCARCHEHKFDPISQKEYYQLQAVFAGVERGERPVATGDVRSRKRALERRQQVLAAARDELLHKITRSDDYRALQEKITRLQTRLSALPPGNVAPSPTNGYHSAIEASPNAIKWVQVDLGTSMPIDAVRLVPARPTDFPDTPGFGFPLRFQIALSDDAAFTNSELVADHTSEDFANPGNSAYAVATPAKRARYVRITAQRLWKRLDDYVFALGELQVYSGGNNVALGRQVTALDSIEAGRWSMRYLVDHFDSRHSLSDNRERLACEIQIQQEKQRLQDLVSGPVRDRLQQLARAQERLRVDLSRLGESTKTYAVVPIPPRPIFVLHRGDVTRKKERVQPGTLSLIPGLTSRFTLSESDSEGRRRAALADWITDARNVLTWRSIVNRVWQYHFGKGLVDTPNDFGKNGGRPTHPELLDWLAVRFHDGGQSFKKLHRMIVLSAAYRQSSRHDAACARIDADNRYLWRQNRQRLDAEEVRDSVLAVSGKLRDPMYGPGYALFRFKDDHSPVYDHTATDKINDPSTFRRTIYRFVVRSVPNPFLETLDCADPNMNVPVRNTTMTALQALALLNNPFMVRQAEFFAARLEKESADLETRIDLAYRLAFGRYPTADEKTLMCGYTRRHGLANACRLLLNSNEFMFVD